MPMATTKMKSKMAMKYVANTNHFIDLYSFGASFLIS
jgi:hypothetical protein